MKSGLEGKSILITGASGGIGSEITRVLAEDGAHCFIHSNRNPDSAAALQREIRERQPFSRCATGQADLRDEGAVEELFEAFGSWTREPYGLVVNAGVYPREATPLRDLPLERWRRTIGINLTGAFLTCREFLRLASERQLDEVAIVLIGSTAAVYGEEDHADYSASKAALNGLMLSLKNELVRFVPKGRVNLVHPGWVRTPMARDALQDTAMMDRITATMPLRKVATPADVAAMVAFLLSSRLAGHLTGVAMPVAGGMEGRLLHPTSR